MLVALGCLVLPSHALVLIPNGDFSDGTNNWDEAGGGPGYGWSYPTNGGSGGGGYGSIGADASSWAILVSPVEPGAAGGGWAITNLGITAGATTTFSIDLKTFSGLNNGGMKVEAWGGNSLLGNSGDVRPIGAAFTDWTTFTFDWLVPAGTEKMIFVPLWGGGSVVGVDNVGVLVTNNFTGSGNWSITNEWANGVAAVNGSSVLFSGAGGNSANNKVQRISGMTFATNAGAYTVSGDGLTVGTNGIVNNSSAVQTVNNALVLSNTLTVSADSDAIVLGGNITGSDGIIKTGGSTLTLSGAGNAFGGGVTLSNGVLRLDHVNAAGSGLITQVSGASTLQINTTGTVTNAMSIFNIQTLQTVTLSGNKTLNNAIFNVAADTTTTESGVLTGEGGITKQGTGTLLVTGNNTFTGTIDVQAGLLQLNSLGSAAGGTTNVIVGADAILLISQSEQVNDGATVSLSGGTIQRGSGVSEVFGDLSLTTGSFLDFGTGDAGNLTFGTYQDNETPSALLTLNNFLPGNSFTFSSTSFSSNSVGSYFGFGTGYVGSSISNDGSTFTITAIPEPSTYLAAAGLLAVLMWPSRRRLLKDAKSVLGLRRPTRDRLGNP
jgi:autotransporter-associated beta strand protein